MAEAMREWDLELDRWPGARGAGRGDLRRHRLRQSRHRRRPPRGAARPRRVGRAAAGPPALGRDRRAPSRSFAREEAARAGPRHDRHDGRRRAGRNRSGGCAKRVSRPIDDVRARRRRWPAFRTARSRGTRAQALPLRPSLRPAGAPAHPRESERVVADLAAAYRAIPRCSRRMAARRRSSSTSSAPSATSSPA